MIPFLDALVERGIADPRRIAVAGQSAGGWATLGLIGRTDRFRSAIASASYSNLVSLYGTFYGQYRYGDAGHPQRAQLLRMLQFERGYFGAGGPPWEQPERYRINSPLWSAASVKTPLLLVHGDQDFIPIQQAEEFFTALYRQDKRVQLVALRRRMAHHHARERTSSTCGAASTRGCAKRCRASDCPCRPAAPSGHAIARRLRPQVLHDHPFEAEAAEAQEQRGDLREHEASHLASAGDAGQRHRGGSIRLEEAGDLGMVGGEELLIAPEIDGARPGLEDDAIGCVRGLPRLVVLHQRHRSNPFDALGLAGDQAEEAGFERGRDAIFVVAHELQGGG